MGAGTGYIATLLSRNGVTVAAYDISPTEADVGQDYGPSQGMHVNDYHGNTPPFCKVTHASSKNTGMFFPNRTTQATALLLCYPPPMSSMAEDTILEFLRIGVRTIVHIGEFQGLTGSKGFENILAKQFQMSTRLSCLRWGTDAADVAILSKIPSVNTSKYRRSEKGELSASLLKCSNCQRSGSKRRCRIARSLTYCSSECFKEHDKFRRIILGMSMIPPEIEISFSNPAHFCPLE